MSQVIGKQLSEQMLVCPPPYLEKRGGALELLRSNRSLLTAAAAAADFEGRRDTHRTSSEEQWPVGGGLFQPGVEGGGLVSATNTAQNVTTTPVTRPFLFALFGGSSPFGMPRS